MSWAPPNCNYLFLLLGILLSVLFHLVLSPPGSGIMSSRRSRSSLSSVLTQKVHHDQRLLEEDKSSWYAVQTSRLTPALADKFVQLDDDPETRAFLEQAVDKADSIFLQMWHNLAKSFLSLFYSQTDINGYLGRGSMFVLSKEQFRKLTAHGGVDLDPEQPRDSLIDLGAGDGGPTQSLKPFFRETFATEASPAMRSTLGRRGIQVLEIDSWHEGRSYDLVSCLNLLDRCDAPLDLLDQIKSASKLVLVALVLPFKPYVEFNASHKPSQPLEFSGQTFEEQLVGFVNLFQSRGFQVLSWTRVPYLCEGDMAKSVYSLDDAVFLLERAE